VKIGITGASGHLGLNVLNLLLERNYDIKCLISGSKRSKKDIKHYQEKCQIVIGDVRNYDVLKSFISNVDILLHFAAIVPPRFNRMPVDYTQEVNVESIHQLLELIEESENPPKLFYPSSVAVWGDVRNKGPIVLTAEDPPNPNENDFYAQQKVSVEKAIRASKITWSIYRFGFIPNFSSLEFDPMMFDVPLDTNMELIHVKDAALAIVNGLELDDIWNQLLLIAGGTKCRTTYQEFIHSMLKTMGIPPLPDEAFGNEPFHCGFMDTQYSQKLLHYQNHSIEDLLEEVKERTTILRFFAKLFRPIVRRYLLGKSPYYQKYKKSQ
jgi:nucleoside-diphosphate-sugar epimerase